MQQMKNEYTRILDEEFYWKFMSYVLSHEYQNHIHGPMDYAEELFTRKYIECKPYRSHQESILKLYPSVCEDYRKVLDRFLEFYVDQRYSSDYDS